MPDIGAVASKGHAPHCRVVLSCDSMRRGKEGRVPLMPPLPALWLILAKEKSKKAVAQQVGLVVTYLPARGRGGIGRRVRFRSVWGQPREGSSPFARTIDYERLCYGKAVFLLLDGVAFGAIGWVIGATCRWARHTCRSATSRWTRHTCRESANERAVDMGQWLPTLLRRFRPRSRGHAAVRCRDWRNADTSCRIRGWDTCGRRRCIR